MTTSSQEERYLRNTQSRLESNTDSAEVELETARGSVYTYLPDGRTQRYKKATGERKEPKDVLVFIPDYNWIVKNAQVILENKKHIVGEDEVEYLEILVDYVHGTGRDIRVIDSQGKELKTNEEVAKAERPCCAFLTKGNVDFYLPVTGKPHLGFFTFDTRRFNSGGQWFRSNHVGNKVIRIKYKDGRVVG
jgi:hypothetical protein